MSASKKRNTGKISAYRAKPLALTSLLALYIAIAPLRKTHAAEDEIAYKWQSYSEENGRIEVIAQYLGIKKSITPELAISITAVNDVITGATPVGSPEEDGSITLSDIEDERNAGTVDLIWEKEDKAASLQYARSVESDYVSDGYAFTTTRYFNKKNIGVSGGLSYTNDTVSGAVLQEPQQKQSWDAYVGLNLVTTPLSTVTFNLSHGISDGYLNDPYKSILQNTEILPGLFLPLSYAENRPTHRSKYTFNINAKRYIDSVDASIDATYRYYTDNWGVDSHTLKLEWYQKFGDKFYLIPKLRFYRQDQADFYRVNLNGLDFTPQTDPDGTGILYSPDYRLAELKSTSVGAKLVYRLNELLSFDLEYERYKMSGLDSTTPAEAFPTANIATVGLLWNF